MILSSVDSLNDIKDNYLRVSKMIDGACETKVALLLDSTVGTTKRETGYIKFFLKDAEANVITAFLFDMSDYAFSGIQMAQMKGKPVELRYTVQVYNGTLSLVIDSSFGIREYKGEFDKEKFIGKINFNRGLLDKVWQEFHQKDFPVEYTTFTDIDLCNGFVGGFAEIASITLNTLVGFKHVVDDYSVLLKCFVVFVSSKFDYYEKKQNNPLLLKMDLLELYTAGKGIYGEDEYSHYLLDVIGVALELVQPSVLYSHLIANAWNNAIHYVNLSMKSRLIPYGASFDFGGGTLLKL